MPQRRQVGISTSDRSNCLVISPSSLSCHPPSFISFIPCSLLPARTSRSDEVPDFLGGLGKRKLELQSACSEQNCRSRGNTICTNFWVRAVLGPLRAMVFQSQCPCSSP